jgi:hypothetical protein
MGDQREAANVNTPTPVRSQGSRKPRSQAAYRPVSTEIKKIKAGIQKKQGTQASRLQSLALLKYSGFRLLNSDFFLRGCLFFSGDPLVYVRVH